MDIFKEYSGNFQNYEFKATAMAEQISCGRRPANNKYF